MAEQLAFLDRASKDDDSDFRLDAHTREVGRRGVAEVRRILAEVVKAAADREQSQAA
jgi:hypothetical protein